MIIRRVLSGITPTPSSTYGLRWISSATASITRIHRPTYHRVYPTVLVFPDGSTVDIAYHEPRKIIKLPVDVNLLNDDEKRRRMERRKPKEKVKVVEENIVSYDPSKYLKKIKRKK